MIHLLVSMFAVLLWTFGLVCSLDKLWREKLNEGKFHKPKHSQGVSQQIS
jgi:hypothetical protein